tara:strand:+ start:2322 stop:2813 length:492 start_codon:yes stop_codon:yes gene_type:complete
MAKKKKHTDKVLENYKKILVAELKKQLRAKPSPTTVSDGSSLENSIVGRKLRGLNGFGIYMNEYGINVNQGRSAGKLPNMGNLEEWINANSSKIGIKDATPKGLRRVLFSIGKSIQKRGIRPYRFIDIVIDKFEPRLTLDLADAYRRDIQEEIDKATPSAKKS